MKTRNMPAPLIFLSALLALSLTAAAADLTLAGPQTDPATIFFAPTAPRLEKVAARELAAYLGRISGRQFTAAPAPEAIPERAVLLGTASPRPAEPLSDQGYLIRADGQQLHIRGGSPRGTIYGVYGFLENHLGCRFWSRNEEFVPSRKTIRIGAAEKATGGEQPYLRRVREAGAGLEAVLLWNSGPLEARGDKLVRTDIGEYTYPRAQALLEHTRGASPREWGGGRSYRMSFRALHGGPLHTLSRGDLTVRVAPLLKGRIRQISYRGEPLLSTGRAGDKGYPQVGGTYEHLKPGARIYETVGDPTRTAVTIRGELGIGHWHSRTKQVVTKRIALPQPDTLRIETSHRLVTKIKTVQTTVVTEYLLGGGPDSFRLEYSTEKGGWNQITLDAENSAELPPADRIRITLPQRGCTVTDAYLSPAVQGGKVTYDPQRKRLVVRATLEQKELPPEQDVDYLIRELRFVPIPH